MSVPTYKQTPSASVVLFNASKLILSKMQHLEMWWISGGGGKNKKNVAPFGFTNMMAQYYVVIIHFEYASFYVTNKIKFSTTQKQIKG